MPKITVYCGEDTAGSRTAFSGFITLQKAKGLEVLHIAGKDLTLDKVENFLNSSSLFGQSRLLVVENLFSQTKSKDKDTLVAKLATFSGDTVVVWEDKAVAKTEQASATNYLFRDFKLPQAVFTFLDRLAPADPKGNLANYHQALAIADAGFIFIMLVRQFRLLYQLQSSTSLTLAPWQKAKLASQAKRFSQEKLGQLLHQLLAIDYCQKTSTSPLTLDAQLELFLSEL